MGAFGLTERRSAAPSTLASDASKVAVAGSTTYQSAHSLTVTPADAAEYVEVASVASGLAGNTTTGGHYVIVSRSFQDAGGAEGSKVDVGQRTYGAAAGECTSDTFTTYTATGSPLHRGPPGVAVTVRTQLRGSNAVAVTSMCSRDATVTGRLVRRISHITRGPFRGAF